MFIVIFSFLNPLANVAYAEKCISFDISWSISGELGGGVDNEVNEPKGEIVMSNSLVYTTQHNELALEEKMWLQFAALFGFSEIIGPVEPETILYNAVL